MPTSEYLSQKSASETDSDATALLLVDGLKSLGARLSYLDQPSREHLASESTSLCSSHDHEESSLAISHMSSLLSGLEGSAGS